MATTIQANSFLQRLVGAAALDAAIYEEVESDPGDPVHLITERGFGYRFE